MSDMSKFIDLYEAITESSAVTPDFSKGAMWALDFLDRNPDQVPGRTITESEYRKGTGNFSAFNKVGFDTALKIAGITVVPDPEPTNAEKLETEIRELFQEPSQSFSIARDLAKKLDKAGWTKAPGGDDD